MQRYQCKYYGDGYKKKWLLHCNSHFPKMKTVLVYNQALRQFAACNIYTNHVNAALKLANGQV